LLRLGEQLITTIPDCEAVSVSLAGYGSDAADSSSAIVDQHLSVITEAMGSQTWHLVGHSMGGFLALQLALRFSRQIRSLSLVEPIALGVLQRVADADAIDADRSVVDAFAAGREDGSGIVHFIEAWNQSNWEDLPESLRARLSGMAPRIFEEARAVSTDRTGLDAYARLQSPVLVVCGRDSPMPVRRVADRLSSLNAVAAVAWIDNSGHMAVLRHPDWFAPVISSFIRQIESS